MKYVIGIIALVIVLAIIFFPRTTTTVSPAPVNPVDKEEMIKQKVEEIRKKREMASPEERVKQDIEIMHHVIQVFTRDKGRLPENVDELLNATHKTGLRFLTEDKVTDPWGKRYVYEKDSEDKEKVIIFSMGPDKTPETEDDIHVPPPTPIPPLFEK